MNPINLIARYPDKFKHVLAGAAIASLVATVCDGLHVAHGPLAGFCLAVLAAAAKEALDWLSKSFNWAARLHAFLFTKPTGTVEWADFFCTVVAAAIAAGVSAWINGP